MPGEFLMYSVWFVGPTDSFLQALFQREEDARDWAFSEGREDHDDDGGFYVVFYRWQEDIPRDGWEGER
jgi:hypothetical protein